MSPPPETAGAARKGDALTAVTSVIAILGGILSVAAALLVTVSVLGRWFGYGAVPGDFELVQIAVALSVFAFLPICQALRGNIMVDTFTTRLPPRVTRAIDAVWDLVYAAAMALIAWSLVGGTRDTFANGTNSMVLGVPLAPVFAICAALVAVLAVTAVVTGLKLLRSRP
ncbi:TRAP transporter small permease [Chelatococcus sp. SYSU_G07232]|uniref:TRAP transporter small permease protein n=1 Tax=Chelatococcus albus TaxID=3047466 RepID=A0ABT7AGL6_9HYPH|nr:TRAP transporter small permease [Chelatococcus sp. SYSU_G07232]MDJ1158519.1 TRAP transporter small permease [Chelatococcus sp. SYSU_G07232]